MPASETGLQFANNITETPENNIMVYQYMYNGAGIAAGDLNNDGLPDLYVCGNSVPNKLFINKGKWKFEDVTAQANIVDRKGDWKTGVTMADVNGDGLLDIYVCYSGNSAGEGYRKQVLPENHHRDNQLFINLGCAKGGVPKFREAAKEFGIDAPGTFSTQAYFFDYDKDGDLDLLLVNHANTFYSSLFNPTRLRKMRHPYFGNKLFRNDHGKFTEVSEQAGIYGSDLNYGLSACISDLNGDNWPDIYVTNDYDEQDFCYLNNKDGTFKEVSHTLFGHLSKYGMGSDAADINNDARPDIFVADMLPEDNHRQKLLEGADAYDKYTLAVDSGYHHQNMRNTLQVNCGIAADSLPRFMELGQMEGVSNTDWSWSPLFADFDNDGYKDLIVTNGYLHDYTNMDFLKFAASQYASLENGEVKQLDMLGVIKTMPSTKKNNYIFKNTGQENFENKTAAWGLTQQAVANAMVYADFDNDGDLDVAMNTLDQGILMYQNHENEIEKNNYIKIKLEGTNENRFGIGAKVLIDAGSKPIMLEQYNSRGYVSSVEPVLTAGVGKATIIKQIKVLWPDDKISLLNNVAVNKTITIMQQQATQNAAANTVLPQPSLLKEITAASGISFKHRENNYVDFKTQRLIPYQASRLGGKMAVGDVNNDGNDDVFFGAAIGFGGELYFGKDDGSFTKAASQPWKPDSACEDESALFFDADNDGDKDLYVVSGGNEYLPGNPLYHDRLYINNGKGEFTKAPDALPADETASGSCVIAADYDHDGDLDLFVGGRITPQLYPITPKSFVLRNDSKNGVVKFTDVTQQLSKDIQLAGMVTDAVWADVDNDGWQDLIVIGEWMPVRVFKNEHGKSFTEITDKMGLANTQSWWSNIYKADVDGDGDTDIVLGNAGLNTQFKASEKQPIECYVQDINNDGQLDPIICYYIQGKSYPLPGLDELIDEAPSLRKKFYKYADYADATISDIVGADNLKNSLRLQCNTLQSSWLQNNGSKGFRLQPLPREVQCSMVNAFIYDDFDGDNKKELLCAGNFYPYRVEQGKSDAFMGTLLKFDHNKAQAYKSNMPLWLTGDIRDAALLHFKNAQPEIIVSRNNDAPSVFKCIGTR